MKRIVFLSLVFLCLAVFFNAIQPAFAQDEAEEKNRVKISALLDRQDVVGGDTVFVALIQEIEDGWHTYWHNPGDSGTAPIIDWVLPKGASEGRLLWPTPHRIDYGALVNYGYEKKAVMLQEITLPAPLPEGPFELKAIVDILVCDDICIPEYHEVSVTVNGEPRSEEEELAAFELVSNTLNDMPVKVTWDAEYKEYVEGDRTYLQIDMDFSAPALIAQGQQGIVFDVLPHEWGIVENTAPTRIKLSADKKILTLFRERGERPIDKLDDLKFLVTHTGSDGTYGAIQIEANPNDQWKQAAIANASQNKASSDVSDVEIPVAQNFPDTGFPKALIFAFIGGLILNLMPCVFPVLSLKALHLVHMSDKQQSEARLSGIAYTAGILLSFLVLALILLAFKGAGSGIGWGFHLQNSLVVWVLAAVLFVFGMNLSGFFEINGRFTGVGSKLAEKEGATGSFFTGILAAVVATPCTAPFMGVAIGYALLQPAPMALSVFMILGLGLATPYLLLSFVPKLRGFMPKPGLWMQRFKEFLAFPLYASAAWLVWVYSHQASSLALLYALMSLVGLAMLVWVFHVSAKPRSRIIVVLIALVMIGFTVRESVNGAPAVNAAVVAADAESGEAVTAYSPENLKQALASDRPVFVNMTAAWCITCKVNEKVALDTQATHELFADQDVWYIKGDWTNRNAEIAEYLGRYGRNGVPIYVFYGAPDAATGQRPDAVVLPQILTPEIIKNTII